VSNLIKIDELTAESILDEEIFKALHSIKDEFQRQQFKNKLDEKAKSLGGKELKDKFTKLCRAYESRLQKSKPEGQKEKPPLINVDGINISRWHETDKDGKPIAVIDDYLVEYILEAYHIFVIAKIPYIYDGGVYQMDESETKLKSIIRSLIYRKLIKVDLVERIYRLIISTNTIQRSYEDLNNFPRHWINFKNGFLDAIKWEMVLHDPKHLSINQIPHEFNMDAEPVGKVTQNFINFAVPDVTDQEMLWQYYGYCLTTDSRLQKFLIFKGQGGTGKSQLIKIVEKMVGYENTSSVSLEQLTENFYPAILLGKLLNSCADIPSKALETVAAIKKITGEDLIIANKKFGSMISFHSYAKLVFSANEIPLNIDEKSEALYRRMLIVKVDKKPDKQNPRLWEQLESEIDYSIMTACKALQRMYKQGKFTESENSKASVTELYMEADNVLAFLVEKTKKLTGKATKSSELFKAYEDYCNENGRKPLSSHGFHKNMGNKGYVKKRYSDAEKYVDIVLTEEALPEDENGFVDVSGLKQGELPFQ
jgi:P4 family phage/plasmid primase-like protien